MDFSKRFRVTTNLALSFLLLAGIYLLIAAMSKKNEEDLSFYQTRSGITSFEVEGSQAIMANNTVHMASIGDHEGAIENLKTCLEKGKRIRKLYKDERQRSQLVFRLDQIMIKLNEEIGHHQYSIYIIRDKAKKQRKKEKEKD